MEVPLPEMSNLEELAKVSHDTASRAHSQCALIQDT